MIFIMPGSESRLRAPVGAHVFAGYAQFLVAVDYDSAGCGGLCSDP